LGRAEGERAWKERVKGRGEGGAWEKEGQRRGRGYGIWQGSGEGGTWDRAGHAGERSGREIPEGRRQGRGEGRPEKTAGQGRGLYCTGGTDIKGAVK
jgi:hypothetical protein